MTDWNNHLQSNNGNWGNVYANGNRWPIGWTAEVVVEGKNYAASCRSEVECIAWARKQLGGNVEVIRQEITE